jgi:NADH-quinone oxidoreductase subunit E
MEVSQIESILNRWNRDPDYLIEVLQDVQDETRYLPEDVLRYVAEALSVPLPRVYQAATFYKAFSLEPRGRQDMQVCMGTACHVKGAPRLLEALERALDVKSGKTTEDGEFTLEPVRCLGCCGLAPVVAVGDDIQGDLSPAGAAKLVKRARKGGQDAKA